MNTNVVELIQDILKGWGEEETYEEQYALNYDHPSKTERLLNYYKSFVSDIIPSFGGTTGCDIGCWFGFSTLILAHLGAGQVYGTDLLNKYIDQAEKWRKRYVFNGTRYLQMLPNHVPLEDCSCDWVVIHQVLCNAFADTFPGTLSESYRILKEGGLLIFCDGNNPYCPDTRERLLKTYHKFEIGSGTYDDPAGIALLRRKEYIRDLAPHLHGSKITQLAKGTAYMWGEQIDEAVKQYIKQNQLPVSIFKEDLKKVPCNPTDGRAFGNITDPYVIAEEMKKMGYEPHIRVSPDLAPVDEKTLSKQLSKSSLFYIYAQKG